MAAVARPEGQQVHGAACGRLPDETITAAEEQQQGVVLDQPQRVVIALVVAGRQRQLRMQAPRAALVGGAHDLDGIGADAVVRADMHQRTVVENGNRPPVRIHVEAQSGRWFSSRRVATRIGRPGAPLVVAAAHQRALVDVDGPIRRARGVDHLRVTRGIVGQGRLDHGDTMQPAVGSVQHVVGRLHFGQVGVRRPGRAAEFARVAGRGELHGIRLRDRHRHPACFTLT